MSSGRSPLGALKKAVQAFFQHDVVLHRNDEGVRLLFEDRRQPVAPRPRSRSEVAAAKDQRELERARNELAALMDQDATLRSTLRHLAFVEHALEKKGWRGLHKVPLDVLQKGLQQLESLVTNWSPEGLACLRSKMAVTVIDREHHDEDNDPDARKTAAVLDNPPDIAAKAIATARRAPPAAAPLAPAAPVPTAAQTAAATDAAAKAGVEATEVADEAALLAAYAALGASAPTGEIEVQGELTSPSAKALRRDGGRPSGFTAL
jgi:hypothetical protein